MAQEELLVVPERRSILADGESGHVTCDQRYCD